MRTTSQRLGFFGLALLVFAFPTSLFAMNFSISFLPEVEDEVLVTFNQATIISYSMVPDLDDDMGDMEVTFVCDVVDSDGVPSPHVGIDNEPPGEPVEKTLTLSDQEPVTLSVGVITVDSFFDIADAVRLRLRADLDGDNALETLATTTLLNSAPTPSIEIVPLQGPVVQASAGKEVEISYAVTNLGPDFVWDSHADILRDDGSDGGAVGSIDGMTPGDPSPRSIALANGETVVVTYGFITVDSFFDIDYKAGLHVQSDLNGDGVFETLASTTIEEPVLSGSNVTIEPQQGPLVLLAPTESITLNYLVTNNSNTTTTFPFKTHENGGYFRIGGGEPGEPLEGSMTLEGGDSGVISYVFIGVDSFFDIYERAAIRLDADLVGDGEFVPVTSTDVLPVAVLDWDKWHGAVGVGQANRGSHAELHFDQ